MWNSSQIFRKRLECAIFFSWNEMFSKCYVDWWWPGYWYMFQKEKTLSYFMFMSQNRFKSHFHFQQFIHKLLWLNATFGIKNEIDGKVVLCTIQWVLKMGHQFKFKIIKWSLHRLQTRAYLQSKEMHLLLLSPF